MLVVEGHPEHDPNIFRVSRPVYSEKDTNWTSPPSSWTKGLILLVSNYFIYFIICESPSSISDSFRPLNGCKTTVYPLWEVHLIRSDLVLVRRLGVWDRSIEHFLFWRLRWSLCRRRRAWLHRLWRVAWRGERYCRLPQLKLYRLAIVHP